MTARTPRDEGLRGLHRLIEHFEACDGEEADNLTLDLRTIVEQLETDDQTGFVDDRRSQTLPPDVVALAARAFLEGFIRDARELGVTDDDPIPGSRAPSKQIVVRVTEAMHDALAADAEANGRTVSQTVRHLLRQALDG